LDQVTAGQQSTKASRAGKETVIKTGGVTTAPLSRAMPHQGSRLATSL